MYEVWFKGSWTRLWTRIRFRSVAPLFCIHARNSILLSLIPSFEQSPPHKMTMNQIWNSFFFKHHFFFKCTDLCKTFLHRFLLSSSFYLDFISPVNKCTKNKYYSLIIWHIWQLWLEGEKMWKLTNLDSNTTCWCQKALPCQWQRER